MGTLFDIPVDLNSGMQRNRRKARMPYRNNNDERNYVSDQLSNLKLL